MCVCVCVQLFSGTLVFSYQFNVFAGRPSLDGTSLDGHTFHDVGSIAQSSWRG